LTDTAKVDFSSSLCEVAKARFERLGWKNVTVICCDARQFRLEDYEDVDDHDTPTSENVTIDYNRKRSKIGADLITMSYSLSMIPDYYPVIDSMSSLLANSGIIGVCDFYVQNKADLQGRNYTGGMN